MTQLFNILKFPIVRHILAGISIVGLLYCFSILPLQIQNNNLREDLKELTQKQQKLIEDLAKKETYQIDNKVDANKLKQGSHIYMVPSSAIKVEKQDSVKPKKRKWWQRKK